MKDRDNCTVIATANVLNITAAEATKLLESFGREYLNGMPMMSMMAAIESRGRTVVPVEVKGKTLGTVLRNMPKRGVFIIGVTSHVLAYINGKEADATPRRTAVDGVYQIIRK